MDSEVQEVQMDIDEFRLVNKGLDREIAEKVAIREFREGKPPVLPNKNIYAKLPAGKVVAGETVPYSKQGEFYRVGNSKELHKALLNSPIYKIMGDFSSVREGGYSEIFNSQFVSIAPIEGKPDRVSLTISFFQDAKAPGARGHHTPGHAQVEVPRDLLPELLERFKVDPDELEKFFQANFPNIDSSKETPGLRRVASSGFYLIDEKDNEKLARGFVGSKAEVFNDFYLLMVKKYMYGNNRWMGTGNRV